MFLNYVFFWVLTFRFFCVSIVHMVAIYIVCPIKNSLSVLKREHRLSFLSRV